MLTFSQTFDMESPANPMLTIVHLLHRVRKNIYSMRNEQSKFSWFNVLYLSK